MYRLQAQKETNLADLLQFVSQMEWNWARILKKKNQSLKNTIYVQLDKYETDIVRSVSLAEVFYLMQLFSSIPALQ